VQFESFFDLPRNVDIAELIIIEFLGSVVLEHLGIDLDREGLELLGNIEQHIQGNLSGCAEGDEILRFAQRLQSEIVLNPVSGHFLQLRPQALAHMLLIVFLLQ
jgi:hypothetical protein